MSWRRMAAGGKLHGSVNKSFSAKGVNQTITRRRVIIDRLILLFAKKLVRRDEPVDPQEHKKSANNALLYQIL